MKPYLFFLSIILLCNVAIAQSKKSKIPKNLSQAVEILAATCPDSLKSIIRTTPEEDLTRFYYDYRRSYKTIAKWIYNDRENNKIEKYLINRGIENFEH